MSRNSTRRSRLADALHRLKDGIDLTSRTMVRLQFEAPWNVRRREPCR